MSPERVWSQWLDEVEAAARAVERQALERAVPALLPLPMPALPWPPALEERRREVLATLAEATATVERCRDETAADLDRLPHAPARPAPSGYDHGATLDVLG